MRSTVQFRICSRPEEIALLRTTVQEYGFASLENAICDDLLAVLRTEAVTQHCVALSTNEDGEVPYKARLAGLGNVAKAFLTSSVTADLLHSVFGERFVLTEGASCYTYYETGDFLSVHRDRMEECAATIILYLDAISPDPQSSETGLTLRVYGVNMQEKATLHTVIPTRIGSLVVGRGAQTWHERPRLQEGEFVAALTACYLTIPCVIPNGPLARSFLLHIS